MNNAFLRGKYLIRHPQLDDLQALTALEALCWDPHLAVADREIRRRLETNPREHFVVEKTSKIIGVIYSQRIRDKKRLKKGFERSLAFYDRKGKWARLLAINIDPAFQDQGLGDELLEYTLQWLGRCKGIEKIVAVTRCRDYVRSRKKTLEEYVERQKKRGKYQDPILHFHCSHGAKIEKVIKKYRPEDVENQGKGILISYSVSAAKRNQRKKAFDLRSTPLVHSENRKTDLSAFVEKSIKTLLGKEHAHDYDPEKPLLGMGLESADLLKLRFLLGERIGRKIETAFFFHYPTAETITKHIMEEKDSGSKTATKPGGKRRERMSEDDIAIVSMACRFPGDAHTPEQFFDQLCQGMDAVGEPPEERWGRERFYDVDSSMRQIRYGGFLKDMINLMLRFSAYLPAKRSGWTHSKDSCWSGSGRR